MAEKKHKKGFEIKWWWGSSEEEKAMEDPENLVVLEEANKLIEEKDLSKDEVRELKDEIIEEAIAKNEDLSDEKKEEVLSNWFGDDQARGKDETSQDLNQDQDLADNTIGKDSKDQLNTNDVKNDEGRDSYETKDDIKQNRNSDEMMGQESRADKNSDNQQYKRGNEDRKGDKGSWAFWRSNDSSEVGDNQEARKTEFKKPGDNETENQEARKTEFKKPGDNETENQEARKTEFKKPGDNEAENQKARKTEFKKPGDNENGKSKADKEKSSGWSFWGSNKNGDDESIKSGRNSNEGQSETAKKEPFDQSNQTKGKDQGIETSKPGSRDQSNNNSSAGQNRNADGQSNLNSKEKDINSQQEQKKSSGWSFWGSGDKGDKSQNRPNEAGNQSGQDAPSGYKTSTGSKESSVSSKNVNNTRSDPLKDNTNNKDGLNSKNNTSQSENSRDSTVESSNNKQSGSESSRPNESNPKDSQNTTNTSINGNQKGNDQNNIKPNTNAAPDTENLNKDGSKPDQTRNNDRENQSDSLKGNATGSEQNSQPSKSNSYGNQSNAEGKNNQGDPSNTAADKSNLEKKNDKGDQLNKDRQNVSNSQRTRQSETKPKSDSSEDAKLHRSIALFCGVFNILAIVCLLLYTEVITDSSVRFNFPSLASLIWAFIPFLIICLPCNITTSIISLTSCLCVLCMTIYLFINRANVEFYHIKVTNEMGFSYDDLVAFDELEYEQRIPIFMDRLESSELGLITKIKSLTSPGIKIFLLTHSLEDFDKEFAYLHEKVDSKIKKLTTSSNHTDPGPVFAGAALRFQWSKERSMEILREISRSHFSRLGENYVFFFGFFAPETDFQRFFGRTPKPIESLL